MTQRFKNRTIALLRHRFPRLFRFLRFGFQYPFILLSRFQNNLPARCTRVSPMPAEHLFGYYDKSPWDASGRYMLFLEIPCADRHPTVSDEALIQMADTQTGNLERLGTTRAWNLQQGARLQWLGPDFRERVLYNDFRDGRFVAVIRHIRTGEERILPRPIYDVAEDGRAALSIDFERLHDCRPGYGYERGGPPARRPLFPDDDGIRRIDLETGEDRLVVSFSQIVGIARDGTDHLSAVHFNHLMINPVGTRFMFLYRRRRNHAEFSNLYTTDLDGSNLFCAAENTLISHATWKNQEEFLVWALLENRGESFHLFRDREGVVETLPPEILKEDGHPSYSPCGRYIVTDTYADRARQRHLLLYDSQERKIRLLGRFYTPFRYSGETRCDLHPRWKPDGTQICIDAAQEGERQVYVVDAAAEHAAPPPRDAGGAPAKPRKKVVILQRSSAAYRTAFYEGLCAALAEENMDLRVIYGQLSKYEKAETVPALRYGAIIRNRYLYIGRRFLVWQPALRRLRKADLIIVQQATRNLLNYPLMLLRKPLGYRLAYWGHGKNFQARNPNCPAERLKRFCATRVDYWFAYNELSAEIVRSLGFPPSRVCAVNNAIDTAEALDLLESIQPEEQKRLRERYGIRENAPVGIFCSRLYKEKRLDFLVRCLEKIREQLPDFHFFAIGDGVERKIFQDFAERHDNWFHYVGAKYGREKVLLFSVADFQLMPGLVGLHLVESFALLTPLVTTRIRIHSPEITYLKDGENGILTEDSEEAYVRAVVALARDLEMREKLREGCRLARETYTMQEMIARFAQGILKALE